MQRPAPDHPAISGPMTDFWGVPRHVEPLLDPLTLHVELIPTIYAEQMTEQWLRSPNQIDLGTDPRRSVQIPMQTSPNLTAPIAIPLMEPNQATGAASHPQVSTLQNAFEAQLAQIYNVLPGTP